MKQYKITLVAGILMMLLLSLVAAHVETEPKAEQQEAIEAGEALVEKKVDCKDLNNEQLESIGEYLMEIMHPGKAHHLMHEQMGIEEGTEAEDEFHVNMAKSMYCNESGMSMMNGGMMSGGNMMGAGGGENMADMNSMMGGVGNMGIGFGSGAGWSWLMLIVGIVFWLAIVVAVILLIIWLYRQVSGKTITGRIGEEARESPLEILQKRFARGELTPKEFEAMKKELGR
ncbi:MAG: SHOCT domain-containing protein [Nanoarchaeota archaeon]